VRWSIKEKGKPNKSANGNERFQGHETFRLVEMVITLIDVLIIQSSLYHLHKHMKLRLVFIIYGDKFFHGEI
jgi:hypothetical protein